MAAPIVTSATTLQGQLLEVCVALEAAEKAYNNTEPTIPSDIISISSNLDNGILSINAQMPITSGFAGNAMTINAIETF